MSIESKFLNYLSFAESKNLKVATDILVESELNNYSIKDKPLWKKILSYVGMAPSVFLNWIYQGILEQTSNKSLEEMHKSKISKLLSQLTPVGNFKVKKFYVINSKKPDCKILPLGCIVVTTKFMEQYGNDENILKSAIANQMAYVLSDSDFFRKGIATLFAALVAGGAVTLILTKLFDKEGRINDSIKNVQAKRLAKDIIEGKTPVPGIDYVDPDDDMLSFKFSAKKELTEAEKNVIETEKRQKEFEKAVKKQDSQKFWKGVNDKAKSIFKNPSTYIISSAIALEIIQITLDMIVLKPVLVKASDIEAITILKAAYPKFEISDYLRYLETTNDIARIENFKKQNIF